MNIPSKPFLDYNDENLPVSLNIIQGQDFYSTSPDYSESTTAKNTYSLSPDIHGFVSNSDQFPLESWSYEGNFLLQAYEDAQKSQTPLSNETDEKTDKKSKRITKRAIAKERTKTKQEATSGLKKTDTMDLLEELDDPNLDDKSKKKQIQKMRNRISAQNSRDRKKVYAQQLEEINGRLVEENSELRREKDILLGEISKLQYSESQLIQEVQTLKSTMCTNCRQTSHQGFTLNNVDTEQNLIDYGASSGGFSGLASPILSRFPSGKGIMSFLTFAAVVSCVVIMNTQPNGEIGLQAPVVPDFKDSARVLEVTDNESIGAENFVIQADQQNFPIVNPYIIQNIEPLKNYFNKNYELLFKQHLQLTPVMNSQWSMVYNTIQPEAPETQNALAMYQSPSLHNLRGKIPTVIAQNLPVIDPMAENQTPTSTLFCPTAFEFDSTPKTFGFPQNRLTERDLGVEKAEYIQLFVPRNRVASVDVMNMTYGYDSLIPTEDSDNSMLEIWCKVFMIRELNSAGL